MSESRINHDCVSWLKSLPDCWGFKVHGGPYQEAGIPDIVGTRRGRFFAAEGKKHGEKPTKLQNSIMQRIRDSGGVAFVYHSLKEFKEEVLRI